MTENRALATGKNSSHPSALPGDTSHADDIDAAMNFMKLSPFKPTNDRPPPHPERE